MRILIVEDEQTIMSLYRIFLEGEGHEVTGATKAQEAIDLYRVNNSMDSPFDLVITDYKLPDKNGDEVIKEILKANPYQKIVLATAYVHELVSEVVSNNNIVLIHKPFDFGELLKVIEK